MDIPGVREGKSNACFKYESGMRIFLLMLIIRYDFVIIFVIFDTNNCIIVVCVYYFFYPHTTKYM